MPPINDKGWSPYIAGALTGIILILSVWVADKYVGASTTFARSSGALERLIAPDLFSQSEYFKKEAPIIDWQVLFVAGILVGSFASAITSGSFKITPLPGMWRERFGPSIPKRAAVAFLGGFIAIFGARLADG
jgi:hypothetical protein